MVPMLLIGLFVAFVTTLVVTPGVISVAKKLRLVDDGRIRKHPANTHIGIIPRAGGLALFIGVLVPSVFLLPVEQIIVAILCGAGAIVLLGVLDDYYDMSPYTRFIITIIVAFFVVLSGLGIPYITNPFGGVMQLDQWSYTVNFFGKRDILILADLFAVFWIVFIMNVVNWSKGVDGQLPGFVSIASIFLGILALRFSGHDISSGSVALLAFIVGGAFLGFLPWNFYPQRIMPGYGGGALAGFFLGVLSILSWGKIGTMVLVLTVPFIDALYVIGRRILAKQSPFRGDAGHFHHRLLQIGWGRRRIAVFYWFVSFLFGLVAIFLQREQKIIAFLFAATFLALFIVVIQHIERIHEVQQEIPVPAKKDR